MCYVWLFENNFAKVSDEAIATWKQILDAVLGSKIVLSADEGRHRARVTDVLGLERAEFVCRAAISDTYLVNYDPD